MNLEDRCDTIVDGYQTTGELAETTVEQPLKTYKERFEDAYNEVVREYQLRLDLAETAFNAWDLELANRKLEEVKLEVEKSLKLHKERLEDLQKGKGDGGDLSETEARVTRLNALLKRIKTLEERIPTLESSYPSSVRL